jgi:hypothetical protein
MMFPSAREGTIDEPIAFGGESPPFFSYLDRMAWCRPIHGRSVIEWQAEVV